LKPDIRTGLFNYFSRCCVCRKAEFISNASLYHRGHGKAVCRDAKRLLRLSWVCLSSWAYRQTNMFLYLITNILTATY